MTNPRILCIAKSGNSKTGPICTTYTSSETCPPRCIFKKTGACYAESGFHTRMAWRRTEDNSKTADNLRTADTLREWIEQNTQKGALIRHNVAGDMCEKGLNILDINLVKKLTEAFKDRRAFTYTHAAQKSVNFGIARKAINAGFTINFSTESIIEAERVKRCGLPAVVAIPEALPKGFKTPRFGYPVVVCPAQTHETITCSSCGLCARSGRACIVAFIAHGNKKSIAIKALKA